MLRTLKPIVELHKEPTKNPCIILRFMFLENHGAKCRRQRQSNESRQRHGYGNRQGELFIQNTCHTAKECNRNEHGGQNKGNSHNRPLYLIHCTLSRIDWLKAFLHMLLDILDNNDGIIDDQTDSQHHSEKRQSVDGKIQDDKCRHGTNQGYWHSQ